MDTPFPLRLEELFFPVQEVRANPDHDPQGDRTGTNLKQSFNVQPIEGQPGVFGVEMIVECDRETSRNPPYFFQLQVYGIMRIDGVLDPAASQALVTSTGFSVLVGASRERLLELTSRAPWGRFMMGVVQLITQPVAESPELSN
jgi:hypothetical protein